jgi:hypothetical protein
LPQNIIPYDSIECPNTVYIYKMKENSVHLAMNITTSKQIRSIAELRQNVAAVRAVYCIDYCKYELSRNAPTRWPVSEI